MVKATVSRRIKEHDRKNKYGKIYHVKEYKQNYEKPRGPIGETMADEPTDRNITFWIKDSQGHFIGRLNANQETKNIHHKRIASRGMDISMANREYRQYHRIFGRVGQHSFSSRRKRRK